MQSLLEHRLVSLRLRYRDLVPSCLAIPSSPQSPKMISTNTFTISFRTETTSLVLAVVRARARKLSVTHHSRTSSAATVCGEGKTNLFFCFLLSIVFLTAARVQTKSSNIFPCDSQTQNNPNHSNFPWQRVRDRLSLRDRR